MNNFESINTNYQNKKTKYSLFWIIFLFLILTLFLVFFFYYPISTYHNYDGYVVKDEDLVLKLYIQSDKLPNFETSKIYINYEKRNFKVKKITSTGELGYMEITFNLDLKPKEKIESNILQVIVLEKEETLFQRTKKTWKEKVNLWLS